MRSSKFKVTVLRAQFNLFLLRYNGQRLYSCSELKQRELVEKRCVTDVGNYYRKLIDIFDSVALYKKPEFKQKRSNPINVSDKSVPSIETPNFVPRVPYY